MIIVNFKTYDIDALALAKTCEEVSKERGVPIIVCPQAADLWIARKAEIKVFSQHTDPSECGQATGWITPESLKKAGCAGTLLNHSERTMRLSDLDSVIQKCRRVKIVSVVCTNNVSVSASAACLKPDYIAIEPPELIGGDVSVTTANPLIISGTVAAIRKIDDSIKILCGAGVKNGRDVSEACRLGVKGVLVASGVVKARNPKMVLEDLAGGL